MTFDRDEIGATLNKLIELNKDSAKGFMRARTDVEDESLADLFNRLSAERAELVDDLQRAVERLGDEPTDETTATGVLARGWLNIKSAMTIEHDKTDVVVIEDRLEHEGEVLEAYERAMGNDTPPAIAGLLQEQYDVIRRVGEDLARQREAAQGQS